jgi:hypothetical protein
MTPSGSVLLLLKAHSSGWHWTTKAAVGGRFEGPVSSPHPARMAIDTGRRTSGKRIVGVLA